MAFGSKANVLKEVLKLMNPEDEAEWLRSGIFNELVLSEKKIDFIVLPSNQQSSVSGLVPPTFTTAPFDHTLLKKDPLFSEGIVSSVGFINPLQKSCPEKTFPTCLEKKGVFVADRHRFTHRSSQQTRVRKKLWKPNKWV